MDEITAREVLYIKLGRGGKWEKDALKKGYLQLGYIEVPHNLCVNGRWNLVAKSFIDSGTNQGVAKRHADQVRHFYEAGEDVLWITFHANKLWWCFSEPKIILLDDKTKKRPVINRWQDSNICGETLEFSKLSGKLLSLQAFRGTICRVKDKSYVLNKINRVDDEVVGNAKRHREELIKHIETLIKRLHWKDFETLIDLIFRQAGWQRLSETGADQKTVDLVLSSPIRGENYVVQIKSKAGLNEWEKYSEELGKMDHFADAYFVVHTPEKGLSEQLSQEHYHIWLPEKIAELSMQYGLVDWVINKTG